MDATFVVKLQGRGRPAFQQPQWDILPHILAVVLVGLFKVTRGSSIHITFRDGILLSGYVRTWGRMENFLISCIILPGPRASELK